VLTANAALNKFMDETVNYKPTNCKFYRIEALLLKLTQRDSISL
jgi:hypothetical protein